MLVAMNKKFQNFAVVGGRAFRSCRQPVEWPDIRLWLLLGQP